MPVLRHTGWGGLGELVARTITQRRGGSWVPSSKREYKGAGYIFVRAKDGASIWMGRLV